jgi:hypothetical protein
MPAEAPPAQTVSAEGLSLGALAGRWPGFPPDLERYYLPIETVVSSDRRESVPLRLADFTLLDASGRERQPVSPRDVTTALFGTYGRQSRLPGGATVLPARTSFYFHGRFGYPYGGYPYGSYGPFGYPYYYDPPYYTYRYRRYADLTEDLLRLGLTESMLEPGAAARAFLYFPPAEGDRTALRLRWSAPPLETALVAPVVKAD